MHPRLEHAADAVALEQERQAGDVVLVWMAQDDRVYPAVPRRDPPIEGHEQAIGSGPPSMRSRPPRGPSTRIASPCPTSRTRSGRRPRVSRRRPHRRRAANRSARRRRPARRADRRPARRRRRVAATVPTPGSARPPRRRPLAGPPPGPPRPHQAGQRQGRRAAATTSSGGSRVTLANGRPAASLTIADQDPQDHPAGRGDDRTDHRWCSGEDQAATRQRDDAGGHGRGHERDDHQVDDGREDRQPTERDEDDRQRRGLGRERDAEAFASQRGTWPRPARSIPPVSGVAQAMRPAVASEDSWKPASPIGSDR